ncbi:hypothetical protein AB0E01_40340 [Nocardia vinacea]|uniref:hypothetical protein n=1 Tax=Nocardia vinacea TaxID=96468 RepID=UPI0033EE0759
MTCGRTRDAAPKAVPDISPDGAAGGPTCCCTESSNATSNAAGDSATQTTSHSTNHTSPEPVPTDARSQPGRPLTSGTEKACTQLPTKIRTKAVEKRRRSLAQNPAQGPSWDQASYSGYRPGLQTFPETLPLDDPGPDAVDGAAHKGTA